MAEVRSLQEEFQKTLENLRTPALPVTNLTDTIDTAPITKLGSLPVTKPAAIPEEIAKAGADIKAACRAKSKRKKIFIIVIIVLLGLFSLVLYLKHRKPKAVPANNANTPNADVHYAQPTIDFSIPGLAAPPRMMVPHASPYLSRPQGTTPLPLEPSAPVSRPVRKRPKGKPVQPTNIPGEDSKPVVVQNKTAETQPIDSAPSSTPEEKAQPKKGGESQKKDPNFTPLD